MLLLISKTNSMESEISSDRLTNNQSNVQSDNEGVALDEEPEGKAFSFLFKSRISFASKCTF